MSIFNINPDLSPKDLEAHITDHTQTDESINLHVLMTQPKIDSISSAHKKLLRLFVFENQSKLKQSGLQLNQKQIHQLRRISVIDLLQGRTQIFIDEFMKSLELSKIAVLKLLIQMNTEGTISIKINEKQGKCFVYSAPSRLKQNIGKLKPYYQSRIQDIMVKNEKYMNCLDQNRAKVKSPKKFWY